MYDLKSQYSRNFNQYPQDLSSALSLLSTHQKRSKTANNKRTNEDNKNNEDEALVKEAQDEEMAFVQSNQKKEPECFLCGGNHYLPKCPLKHLLKEYRENTKDGKLTPKTTASSMLIQDDICREVDDDIEEEHSCNVYDFAFAQKTVTFQELTKTQKIILSQKTRGNLINPNWILLDSQSTINIFDKRKLFSEIRDCKKHEVVRCYCNGGYQDTHKIGTVPGIGQVYYNPKSLANIISLSKIDDIYRVTYNSDKEKV